MADPGRIRRLPKFADVSAKAEIIVDHALIYHDSPDSRTIEWKFA
jgi:hypothetical protein